MVRNRACYLENKLKTEYLIVPDPDRDQVSSLRFEKRTTNLPSSKLALVATHMALYKAHFCWSSGCASTAAKFISTLQLHNVILAQWTYSILEVKQRV